MKKDAIERGDFGGDLKPVRRAEPVEVFFLKYSFPCAFIAVQRGKLSQEEFLELEKAAIFGVPFPRGRLEEIFVPAFRRMRKLGAELGLEVWSQELMEEYYLRRHNKLIDVGDGAYADAPAVLRELCKVRPARVLRVGELGAVVKFDDGRTRAVMTDLVESVSVGERVVVHYGYVVEKVV